MPNDRPHDLQLAASGGPLKGFKIWRNRAGGRSWRRTGVPNLPGTARRSDVRHSTTSPEVRFARAYDDFSGGDGYAYRGIAPDNGIHWSENYDTRWPGQAVHCQAALFATLRDDFDGSNVGGVQWMHDLPLSNPVPETGFGGVVAYGRRENITGDTDAHVLYPKSTTFPPALDATYIGTTTRDGKEGPPAVFGSYFYIGGSSGNFFRGNLDGGALGAVGSINAHGFVNAGNRLWAAVGPYRRQSAVRSLAPTTTATAGLFDADWSASLVVGNGRGPILDLVSLDDQVFLGLPDGLYAGDQSGTFLNVTGQVGQNANELNFRDLCIHEGEVIGQHVSGVYAYNPKSTTVGRVREIGPALRSSRSPVKGIVTAVHSYGGWLYAGQWTGSQSYLRAGREAIPGSWRWHTLNRFRAPGRVHRLHVDGITYGSGLPATSVPNRFWAAMAASFDDMGPGATPDLAPLYFWPVPPSDGNPLAGGVAFSANYNGSARMDLPADDLDAPGITKIFERVEVTADAMLSGGRYLDVYYTMDRGTRTLLGRAQTGPVAALVAGSTNGYFVSGKSVEWSVESFTDVAGSCPVLRSIVAYGKMRPQVAEVIEAQVHIADGLVDRQGVPYRPASVMIDELRAMADPTRLGNAAAVLVDISGATQYVAVLPPIDEHEAYEQGTDAPEVVATLRMAVLSLSAA